MATDNKIYISGVTKLAIKQSGNPAISFKQLIKFFRFFEPGII